MKPWVQAGQFDYHEPHYRNFFFSPLRGQSQTSKEIRGVLESSDLAENFFVSLSINSINDIECNKDYI